MALILHYHPLSSYCWKALIALYENKIEFTPHLVDLMNEESRNAFLKIWPIGQFPVLEDSSRQQIIPQSTVIIEYLHLHYPGVVKLIPADLDLALETRRWNEFIDDYVHVQMQKAGSNNLRPKGQEDLLGEAEARKRMRTAYDVLEKRLEEREWLVGKSFTMADISACPALFYGSFVEPFQKTHPTLSAYLKRLKQRPVFARVLKDAEPYFQFVPIENKPRID